MRRFIAMGLLFSLFVPSVRAQDESVATNNARISRFLL